ncbi:MAG TPA: hypothetical protein VLG47_03955 [Candidatus Saccharimonadales bacterium]|nr:hypothetical protein [Candidatus Saccharimonadales bacterium]
MDIINPKNLYVVGIVFILQYFAADYIKGELSTATLRLSSFCAWVGILLILFALPAIANLWYKDK